MHVAPLLVTKALSAAADPTTLRFLRRLVPAMGPRACAALALHAQRAMARQRALAPDAVAPAALAAPANQELLFVRLMPVLLLKLLPPAALVAAQLESEREAAAAAAVPAGDIASSSASGSSSSSSEHSSERCGALAATLWARVNAPVEFDDVRKQACEALGALPPEPTVALARRCLARAAGEGAASVEAWARAKVRAQVALLRCATLGRVTDDCVLHRRMRCMLASMRCSRTASPPPTS